MRICHTLLCSALLGSALASIAIAPVSAGTTSRADLDRLRAATGRPSSTALQRSGAVRENTPSTYTVLHDFAGGSGDGQSSTAEVTLDTSGNIYGTANYGGANNGGVLFELATGGTETLLHSFGGSGDGSLPDGAVTLLSSGDMYGTTQEGGSTGSGTIWKLTAGGTYTVLHNFGGTTDGSFIRGRLVQDKKGNFYGTALFGGVNSDGVVFKYTTSGKLKVLHAFNGNDGEFPEHGVVRDKAGNLYGVTAFGGANGDGTVYKIARDGTFTTLYSFTGGTDGSFLYGGLAIDKAGNLYGSTVDGGANNSGTVFELAPDGTLTTLYSFTGGADGGGSEGDMLLVGKNLYGAATIGGSSGNGGIFRVALGGKEKMLASFTASGGDGYSAGVTANNSTLYGTTAGGGTNGYGVVFSLAK